MLQIELLTQGGGQASKIDIFGSATFERFKKGNETRLADAGAAHESDESASEAFFRGKPGGKENAGAEKDTPEFPTELRPGAAKVVTGLILTVFIVNLLCY